MASLALVSGCSVKDTPRMELPLPIPPVLTPTRVENGVEYYELHERYADQRMLPDGPLTQIMGYEGVFPGPTIVAHRGTPTQVTIFNELDVPTVTHNHGHNVTPGSDGHPVDFVPPGTSRVYNYPNAQGASSFFLHDHTMGATSPNVWHGLIANYEIMDDEWQRLKLPSGDYDVPLALADKSFNGDNSFFEPQPPTSPLIRFGDVMTVNGVRTPVFEVANRKYLFRILNASDLRDYRLFFQQYLPDVGFDAPHEWFSVVASDGGLLGAPVERNEIYMAPAERYAIVFDFSKFPVGTTITLQNSAAPAVPRFAPLRYVMSFYVAREEADDSQLPAQLTTIQRIDPNSVVTERQVILSRGDGPDTDDPQFFINGKQFDPNRIDFQPHIGDVELWTISNFTTVEHTLHLHEVQFQMVEFDGEPPRDEQMGWKDTVPVDPNSETKVLVRWYGNPGVYVFHCHMLQHEDHAMMGQFQLLP